MAFEFAALRRSRARGGDSVSFLVVDGKPQASLAAADSADLREQRAKVLPFKPLHVHRECRDTEECSWLRSGEQQMRDDLIGRSVDIGGDGDKSALGLRLFAQ